MSVPEKLGAVAGHFGTVDAFEYNLLDHQGRVRARLGTNEGGEPGFALFAPGTDEKPSQRAELLLAADGPQLRLYHAGTGAAGRGRIGVLVKVADSGGTSATLLDRQGKPRAFLLLPADGGAASGGIFDRRGRMARFAPTLHPTPADLAGALEPLVLAGKRRAFERTAAGLLGTADGDFLGKLWRDARARLVKPPRRVKRSAA